MSREKNFLILFPLTINLKRAGSSLEVTSSDAINMKRNETQKKRDIIYKFVLTVRKIVGVRKIKESPPHLYAGCVM